MLRVYVLLLFIDKKKIEEIDYLFFIIHPFIQMYIIRKKETVNRKTHKTNKMKMFII